MAKYWWVKAPGAAPVRFRTRSTARRVARQVRGATVSRGSSHGSGGCCLILLAALGALALPVALLLHLSHLFA